MQLIFITSDYGVAVNPELEDQIEKRVREAVASGQAVECICLPVGRRPLVVEVTAPPPPPPPPPPVMQAAPPHPVPEPGLKERKPRRGD